MTSPLLPFNANIIPADGAPYTMRMSQGFNETLFFGSGLPQDQQQAQRIQALMAACRGEVALGNVQEVFLSHLMALSWHIEYLTTALVGENTTIDNHEAFLNSIAQLGHELTQLRTHPILGNWVVQRLQDAQFRHFQRFGQQAPALPMPEGPVQRPLFSPWTSLPHLHAPLLAPALPPLVA